MDWMFENSSNIPPNFMDPSDAEERAAGKISNEIKESVEVSATRTLRLTCKDGSKFHKSFDKDGMEGQKLKLHWKPNDVPVLSPDGKKIGEKKSTQIWAYFYVGVDGTETKIYGNKKSEPKANTDYADLF